MIPGMTPLLVLAHLVLHSAATLHCSACPQTVPVPTGEYWMGSAPEALARSFLEPDRVLVEQPRLRVRIAEAYEIGVTEVTRGEYRRFVESSGHRSAECLEYDFAAPRWVAGDAYWGDPGFEQTDDHPVVCVSWHDAQAYAAWLTAHSGDQWRLPTEAQWEYAARAGTQSLFPWGEDKDEACEHANVADRSGLAAGVASAQAGIFDCDDGHVFTAPADFGRANGWGLHGMIGNVGEWQQDCMVRTLAGAPRDGSARLSADCHERAIRGGSWFNPPMYGRPAFRYGTDPGHAFTLVGFRLVRIPNAP